MIYNYYPGCTLSTKAKALDQGARAAAAKLGIPLVELPEWQCCGAVYPMAPDAIAERLSAVRALAAAKANGGVLVTLCSACHHVLKRVNDDMAHNEDIRKKVNNYLELDEPYAGETKVLHFLEVLRDQVGFDKLATLITHPLTGKKIGAYYGCMFLRPAKVMEMDDPESPQILEKFITALGAEPAVYGMRNECCAGYMAVTNKGMCQQMVKEIIASAKGAKAEALITACPLCRYNLVANAATDAKLPVYYFTELLAEALGIELPQEACTSAGCACKGSAPSSQNGGVAK